MRILIIGEYSGFAKNLKIGFVKSGHEAVVFSWGDLFKKIKSEFPEDYYINATNLRIGKTEIKGSWLIKYIFESISFGRKVKQSCNAGLFDAVLVLNLDFVRFKKEIWKPFFSMDMIKTVVKDSKNIYLSLCGNDFIYNSSLSKMRIYNPIDIELYKNPTKRALKLFRTFSSEITRVIPVMYDYAEPYRRSEFASLFSIQPTVPLPLFIDSIPYDFVLNDKIVIFHGLNRATKGTSIIIEALNRIRASNSNVEVIVDGNLPLDKYLEIIKKTNIIVDQCYGFSYGMNAIYSMAMGKVVLSGNEPECMNEFKRNDIPVINIEPNVDQIVCELQKLIDNPALIREISLKSRLFVENFHESAVVAQQYVEIFKKNNDLAN